MEKRLILVLVALISISASGQWVQVGEDIDGEAKYDISGSSVSLSSDGTVVAIGAPMNDANLTRRGHVRVYKNTGGAWTQKGQDIDGVIEYEWSGHSVSLNSTGSIVAIGSAESNLGGQDTGNVRIYEYNGSTWTQMGQVIVGSIFDNAGYSVSLSANGFIVAVGCPEKGDLNTTDGRGHVQVYEYNGSNWIQTGQDIVGQLSNDYSGTAVSLSSDGTIVAIGARRNSVNGPYRGHVRVYENSGGNWVKIGQDIVGEAAYDYSGTSVSLSSDGSIVAIGADWNDGAYGINSGHVRVYENNGGTWTQLGQDIDGESEDSWEGSSVSLSADGSVVAIGAERDNNANGFSSGQVRLYQFNGGTWNQVGEDIHGEAAGDYSGTSISLSSDGSIVAIGAPENQGTDYNSGHVRVFENSSLGVDDLENTPISVYPNPVEDKLTIESTGIPITKSIIYSIQGQVVLETSDNDEIDVANLPSGVYFIQITAENRTQALKFVKK